MNKFTHVYTYYYESGHTERGYASTANFATAIEWVKNLWSARTRVELTAPDLAIVSIEDGSYIILCLITAIK